MLTSRATALLCLATTCVRAAPLPAQRGAPRCAAEGDAETVARLARDVRYLADDAREGREAGSAGFDDAAAYVVARLALPGVEAAGAQGFLQPLSSRCPRRGGASDGRAVRTANVLARVRGASPDGLAVLVGAHLDHVGRGARGSRSGSHDIHNGADDNASGAAVVLELARRLSARPAARDVVLAWFGAEESGLHGSTHLATHPVEATRSLAAMVNFDMVGRLRDCRVVVEGWESAPGMPQALRRANAPFGFDLRPWDRRLGSWGSSDHMSFASRGTPYVFFFTGLHGEYHTERDDPETLNLPGAAALTDLAERAIREVASMPAASLRRARRRAGRR
ncbi:MAG: M20/M25/M40 family metallo-hydrolase [Polyangiales bacterium]